MENLRVVSDLTEIYNFIEEAILLKAKIMLWQNIEGERSIFRGNFAKVNIITNKLLIKVDNARHFGISEKATLYIRCSHKSILFKTRLMRRSKNSIAIEIPQEVRAHEYRNNPRVILDAKKDRRFFFEKFSLYQSTVHLYEEVLLDISEKGLAFVTNYNTVSQIQTGETISIVQLGGKAISPRLEGVVVYSRSKRIQDANHVLQSYRVGVEFQTPLSKETLHQVFA